MPKLIVVDLVEFRPEIIVLTLATGLFFSSMFVCMTPIFTISMSVNEPADQECLFWSHLSTKFYQRTLKPLFSPSSQMPTFQQNG